MRLAPLFLFALASCGKSELESSLPDKALLCGTLQHKEIIEPSREEVRREINRVKTLETNEWVQEYEDGWLGVMLHIVAENGYCAWVVDELIRAGAKPNAKDHYGKSPLYRATGRLTLSRREGRDQRAKLGIIRALIHNGADPNPDINWDEETPLQLAVSRSDAETIQLLIELGADANVKSPKPPDPKVYEDWWTTPLMIAAKNENGEKSILAMKALLDAGADPNRKSFRGETALHFVFDSCDYISAYREDGVNSISNKQGGEILQKLELLLNAGADVNAGSGVTFTPLMRASFGSNPDIYKFLIDAGADLDARDSNGGTPLAWAVHAWQAQILLLAGADLSTRDNDGRSVLHGTHSADLVRYLLACGADIDAQMTLGDFEGYTPLMLEVYTYRSDLVSDETITTLVEAGANLLLKTADGQSLKDLADANEHFKGTTAYWDLLEAIEKAKQP